MKIILIGYRGSGKTTVGRILAARLGLEFLDIDHEVCRKFANPSIADIWQKHGEPEWRRVEVETTREICSGPDRIIALGGGTLMQPGAREAVVSATGALRVYLQGAPQELYRRISQDKQSAATRPSLTKLGGGLDEVRQVLLVREPVYKAVSDIIIDVDRIEPESAAARIVEAMGFRDRPC